MQDAGVQHVSRLRSSFRATLLVSSLALRFGPALVEHMRRSTGPFVFNDDVRQQIYPLLRYADPGLFPGDLAARYYLDCYPLGYRLLYAALAPVWSPIAASKVLPYLLLAVVLVALGLASFRLAGWLTAWFTLVFCLSSPYVLARLAGGLPRAFGLALLACAIAALVYGRMRALAVCTVAAAAWYPPVAVLNGLALALTVLVFPQRDRGTAAAWGLQQRVVLIGLTLVLCVAVLLPTALISRRYGRLLRSDDVAAYPELGVQGRYGAEDRAPFDPLPLAILKLLPEAFRGRETSWLPGFYDGATAPDDLDHLPAYEWVLGGIVAVLCAGVPLTLRASAPGRRLGALLVAACSAYLLARPVAPSLYLPQRYTAYAIPLLAVILLPAAVQALPRLLGRAGRHRYVSTVAVVVGCGVCYLLTGGSGNAWAGLVSVDDGQMGIYQAIAALPASTRLAAWPSELADNIPYLSQRQVLISYEVHQIFHQGYADEMRRRMQALIGAYYATDPAPLIALRDAFGVDYLVVDERHFTTRPPSYFQPFQDEIQATRVALPSDPRRLEVFRQMPRATVFRDGPLVVLDLRRLSVPETRRRSDSVMLDVVPTRWRSTIARTRCWAGAGCDDRPEG